MKEVDDVAAPIGITDDGSNAFKDAEGQLAFLTDKDMTIESAQQLSEEIQSIVPEGAKLDPLMICSAQKSLRRQGLLVRRDHIAVFLHLCAGGMDWTSVNPQAMIDKLVALVHGVDITAPFLDLKAVNAPMRFKTHERKLFASSIQDLISDMEKSSDAIADGTVAAKSPAYSKFTKLMEQIDDPDVKSACQAFVNRPARLAHGMLMQWIADMKAFHDYLVNAPTM